MAESPSRPVTVSDDRRQRRRARILSVLAPGLLLLLGGAVLVAWSGQRSSAHLDEAYIVLISLVDFMAFMQGIPRRAERLLLLLGLWAPAFLAVAVWGTGRLLAGVGPRQGVRLGLQIGLVGICGLVGGVLLPDLARAARSFANRVRSPLPPWVGGCSLGGALAVLGAAPLAVAASATGMAASVAEPVFCAVTAVVSVWLGGTLLRRRGAPLALIQPYVLVAFVLSLDVLFSSKAPWSAWSWSRSAAAAHLLAVLLLAPEALLHHQDLYRATRQPED